MVEIGVYEGGSLEMWKRYLGPSAQIIGIDIDPRCRTFEAAQIAVRIGDQGDPGFLQGVLDEFGPIDIVLDDGSHRAQDSAVSFDLLYPQLDRNGIYVVEDTGTSYLAGWGGGLRREGTFVEVLKDRIDELHAASHTEQRPTSFSEMTRSLHVYKNLVVFERGRHVDRRAIRNGTRTARRPSPSRSSGSGVRPGTLRPAPRRGPARPGHRRWDGRLG